MLGQAGVDKQVADSFLNMAFAMLVAIGLVYLIMVVLFRSLLVPVVILCPLPLAVIGHALDLSALIGLLMLIDIVVINATVLLDLAVATNAIVLLDLVQYKIEAGADVRTTLIQDEAHAGAPRPDEAAATIIALIPLALSSDDGLIAASLATVVIGPGFSTRGSDTGSSWSVGPATPGAGPLSPARTSAPHRLG
jgi:hydrophobic/amphiphilic exporter-1 (mainly G- bacteria), HAE1 family